jgi:membrane protease YdiL (CAAX protease family)
MSSVEELHRARKPWLAIECGLLFAGVPVAYAWGWLRIPVIALLVIMAGGCWIAFRQWNSTPLRQLFRTDAPKGDWRRMLILYAIAVPGMIGFLWLIKPDALFSLIIRHPKIWLLVMLAYPIISVLPQEYIYRVFFFDRYRRLFGGGKIMIAASAVVFSLGHIVFHNWPAIILTFLGGCLFGRTYQRTSALLLVSIEHALYGCAVFTIGYGAYFVEGTLRLFR